MFNHNDIDDDEEDDYYYSKIGNSSAQDDSRDGEEEEGSYESCLSLFRKKHDLLGANGGRSSSQYNTIIPS